MRVRLHTTRRTQLLGDAFLRARADEKENTGKTSAAVSFYKHAYLYVYLYIYK